MNKERKKMKFEILLERYFTNFHRILLLNLIFAVPSAAAFGVSYWLNYSILSEPNIFISLLPIILLFPFYSGVVAVVRNIARGDEDVSVFSTYLSAFKTNFLSFLLHGVVVYAAAVLSYLSVTMYIGLLKLSWFMYVLLFICIVVVVFVTFTVYYIPLMEVTFQLKKRFIYKNSFLMSFGEFKNNFFATFALAIVLAIFFTVTVFCHSVTVLILVCAGFWALLLPATGTFMVVFFIYDGMYNLITNKENRKKELEERIDNGGKKVEHKAPEVDYSDIDISTLNDPEGYIYHNGRMVKQKVVIEQFKRRQQEMGQQDE
ncbi:MAG: YesL family protein [Ruminococcus sp.]|nr:YesL family protein [Ruminococcus sp.]